VYGGDFGCSGCGSAAVMAARRRKREMRKEVVSFIAVVCILEGSESDVFLDSKRVTVAIKKGFE
jgi:Fe-S cluster biogenesis protein NfuA